VPSEAAAKYSKKHNAADYYTAVYSHSCSLLMVTASCKRPTLLAWPKHHQSGSHCIFLPGHHMTRSLLQYSKHRHYPDRCVDFLEAVTSHTVDPRKSNGLILEQIETRTKFREKFCFKLE
jgi:hypothetical protein